MTREPCPRCGSERPTLGPCPECGYEQPHPGVLGSYRRALGDLVDEPALVLPFLLPTLLLLALRWLIYLGGDLGGSADVVEGLAGVVVLYLGMSWYFAAVGSVGPTQAGRPSVPGGPVYLASAIGAGLVAAPLAGFVLLVGLRGPKNLGAVGLLASILLLLSSIVVAGRAVGLPVEAASANTWSLDTLRRGNERGREQGGLGLVFLAFLLLVPLVIVPPLARFVLPDPWAGYAQLALSLVGLTLVGAWTGVAIAMALAGEGVGVEETFTCPLCGGEARAEGGRARCECGLEGPYYPGERA